MSKRITLLAAAGILSGTLAAAAQDAPDRSERQPEKPRFRSLLAPAALSAANEENRRLKVAVLDFFERTPYTRTKGSLGHSIALTLAVELDKTGRFEVFAREDLDSVLSEVRLENGSPVTDTAAARFGKLAKVDYVIYGDIEKLEVGRSEKGDTQTARVTVNYKVLAADSGRVWRTKELSASAVGAPTDDSREVTERAIQRTIEDFVKLSIPEPTGKVALIDAEKGRFVINLGEANGIERGNYFQVVRLGREIRDPDSGEVIEREKEIVCWGRVVEAGDKVAFLEPGEYSKSDIGVVRWKKRRSKLDEVRVGDTVQVADARKTLY